MKITSYNFDANSNITSKTITHPTGYTYSYTANNAEQTLTDVSSHSYSYSYNSKNQLLSMTESVTGLNNGESATYQSQTAYTYDANGNTIKAETGTDVAEYTYNQLNQLTSYESPDGTVTQYGYDGTGMRTSKTQNGITTKYYWDRGYIANEGVNSTITATNYIGLTGIIGRESGTDTDYFFKNGHGDVVANMRNGSIINTYDYDAYGNEINPTLTDTNPFRYCGEYYDTESRQLYLRNRYYDPSTGSFITEDPIRDGLNWYSYCGGNPGRCQGDSYLDTREQPHIHMISLTDC